MPRRKTTKEFISDAKKVHNNKYNYSKCVYYNNKIEIIIICPKHGQFKQRPDNHLSGKGCSKCSGTFKLTSSEFFKRCKKIHKGKYDYTDTIFTNINDKIDLICKKHNYKFTQIAKTHLKSKHACKLCLSENKRNTTEWFIKEAMKVHGNRYDYKESRYVGSKKKIKIFCKAHSEYFYQRYDAHLNTMGCRKCAGNFKKNTESFIKEAMKVHGNRYDYKMVNYTNSDTKVKIICKRHGIFKMSPIAHTYHTNGCPKCNLSKGELKIISYLESKNIKYHTQKTFKNLKNINTGKYLKFDFYLPKHNMCIEYDGKQHFKPIDYFGGKEGFESLKIRDSIKNKWCETNSVYLHRIAYFDLNNIEKILDSLL